MNATHILLVPHALYDYPAVCRHSDVQSGILLRGRGLLREVCGLLHITIELREAG